MKQRFIEVIVRHGFLKNKIGKYVDVNLDHQASNILSKLGLFKTACEGVFTFYLDKDRLDQEAKEYLSRNIDVINLYIAARQSHLFELSKVSKNLDEILCNGSGAIQELNSDIALKKMSLGLNDSLKLKNGCKFEYDIDCRAVRLEFNINKDLIENDCTVQSNSNIQFKRCDRIIECLDKRYVRFFSVDESIPIDRATESMYSLCKKGKSKSRIRILDLDSPSVRDITFRKEKDQLISLLEKYY